jgi:hypothetical protein
LFSLLDVGANNPRVAPGLSYFGTSNANNPNLFCFGANNPRVAREPSYLGPSDTNNPKLPQVGDSPVPVYHSSGPISRSNYTNTHDQTKALVALCVPKRFCQSWESAFDDCRDADRALDALRFSECSLPPSGKFGITPLCWLEHAFRTSIVGPNHIKVTELCMGESPTQTSSLFDIREWHDLDFKSRAACEDVYLLDVVLHCQLRPDLVSLETDQVPSGRYRPFPNSRCRIRLMLLLAV